MTTKMINATQLGNRKEELKNDILLVQSDGLLRMLRYSGVCSASVDSSS